MIKKLKSGSVIQRIAAVFLGIAVLVYAVYHISSLFGEDIATIPTGVSTESRVVDAKGYIFRDETVLYSDNTGVSDYLKSDGAKVSTGEALANVYSQGSTSARSILRLLDSKIAILEESVLSGATLADLPEVNDNISDAYYSLVRSLSEGDTGGISEQADKLLLNMNMHSMLTDDSSPVDNTLASMKAQRDSILKNGGDSVTEYSQDSGYFYSYVDGYEEGFTLAAADGLTAATFYELTEGGGAYDASLVTGSYGKLAHSSEWRFAVKVSELSKEYFTVGNTYRFKFVENGNTVIPMTLTTEIEDSARGGMILVFSANRLPNGFVFSRCQSVSVTVNSISGIYVPKSAVYRSGGTYCVYVLRGSVVCYRRIEVIYEGSDYFLCDADAESTGGAEYLGTNELLIIKGNNLFDGRILD